MLITKTVSCFLGFVVIALLALTLIQILARYFLKASLSGWEEVPMYLMIAGIWIGAVLLSKDDTHLRLDGIGLIIKNQKIIRIISFCVDLVTMFALLKFSTYMIEYTGYCFSQGMITPGIGLPIYLISGLITICLLSMTFYVAIRCINVLKESIHGNRN